LFDAFRVPNQVDIDNAIYSRSIRAEVLFRPGDFIELRSGIDILDENFDFQLSGIHRRLETDLSFLPYSAKNFISAVRRPISLSPYTELVYYYFNVLRIQAGLRLDRFKLPAPSEPDFHTEIFPEFAGEISRFKSGGRTALDPRLSLDYRFSDKLNFSFAWGIFHQNLQGIPIQDEASIDFLNILYPIDLSHEAMKAGHLVGGINYRPSQMLDLSIRAYRKRIDNLLQRRDLYYSNSGDGIFMEGKGEMDGIEFLIGHTGRDVRGWIGYSLSRARGIFDERSFNLDHDRRHSLNLVLHLFDWAGGWESTINWLLHSGSPFSRLTGTYRLANFSLYSGQEWLETEQGWENYTWKNIKGPKNDGNFPVYHRLDFSVRRRLKLTHFECIPYVQILNLYHQDNLLYFFKESRSVFQAEKVNVESRYNDYRLIKMLPVIFSFGCQIEF
jgi:hypothetical protein